MAEAQGLDQAGDDKMSETEWVGACEDCGAPLVARENGGENDESDEHN